MKSAISFKICDVMAPRDGKALFRAVLDHRHKCEIAVDVGLKASLVANQNAPSKSLKTRILSTCAQRFSANELKEVHQPFENLFDRPEVPIEKIPRHRIRIGQRQLDHFVEFTTRPYCFQDAPTSRSLVLNGPQSQNLCYT